jgi:hypothetical protein
MMPEMDVNCDTWRMNDLDDIVNDSKALTAGFQYGYSYYYYDRLSPINMDKTSFLASPSHIDS